ncbi:MAG: Ppx/GppA phosphatase family protein [Hyphomicrobiales bacterium]
MTTETDSVSQDRARENSRSRRRSRRRRRSSRSGQNGGQAPVYGALDLGTNNCRLLLARPEGEGFRVIDAFSRIIRLGEGITRSGKLSEAAIERAIEALKVCTEKMIRSNVISARLIATEACRVAENADEFIFRVREKTGLNLEIIDSETEARLAVAGCSSLLDHDADAALVFDIGGGSSELVWVEIEPDQPQVNVSHIVPGARPGPAHTIRGWLSLPVGVVNIAERFGGVDVDENVFESMVADIAIRLEKFEETHQIAAAIKSTRVHLLGTSGTVTTVAGIHLGLARYDRRHVDGSWLDCEQALTVSRRLLAMDYEERVRTPCIGHERADLVLAGCAIMEAIMRSWPCDRLRVADRGLREGILIELMAADGYLRAVANDIDSRRL